MKFLYLITALAIAMPARGDVEEHSAEHHAFSGAKKLIIDDVLGSIEAVGYSGAELQVDADRTQRAESAERADVARREVKLDISQSGDVVRIFVDGPWRCHCGDDRSTNYRGWRHDGYEVTYNFKLKVPRGIFLDLRTVSHGGIKLDHTVGDFDVRDVNSPLELTEVTGSGSAHTVNGGIKAAFAKSPAGACSFHTVNGVLDVTFPSDLAADVRVKTLNGGLYTDFDVSGLPIPVSSPERSNGRFVYRSNRYNGVRIGKGGVEMSFETVNGNVLIRKQER